MLFIFDEIQNGNISLVTEETTQQPPETIDNVHSIDDVLRLFNRNTAWLLFALFTGISWIVYITFYSSRVTGLVATKVLNRFVKSGYIDIGSISLSVLSGKVMFRDVTFITEDCAYRIQDGWIIFRWWRAYVPKDISEDFSHSDTRLSVLLNGFEYHLYNRSEMYSNLEKLFGIDPVIIPGGGKSSGRDGELEGKLSSKPPSAVGYSWRDLIPVIKLELCSGRVVFGNSLAPYTLAIIVEEANLIYSTKPADSKYDHFMHIVKCKSENFKVMLSPSPKYTGLKDDPPRLMGEGFGVVTSNKIEFYYYMDEPGVVPSEPEMLQLANGDLVESNPPIWGIDIKCGKGTDFSYGPWADRQRDALFKLFFPQDYQPLKRTNAPTSGEERQIQSFDIRLSTLTDATIDILFSKDEETNAVHMNIGPGSYLEVTIPWVVHSDGYATKITGQLLHLEASTSLQFRDLVVSESLQFGVTSHYPLHWNDHQECTINLTGCKATAYLIYAHKWFFQALINDWSSRTPPDLLRFIPYTWKIDFSLKEFELITTTNEYNWIDCSSQYHENTLIAASGELFELSFSLPFHEFLPETILFKFWIQIECGDLYFYVPEVSTAYAALQSLIQNAKIRDRDGKIRTNLLTTEAATEQTSQRGKVRKWRNVILASDGWIECWAVPICAVSIGFTYHPVPPLGPSPQADVPTPEKEEILLQPIRIPDEKNSPPRNARLQFRDPLSLPPDRVHVELEVGPSVLLLYGTLLPLIINLKENVFGDNQDFNDMEKVKGGLSNNFTYKGAATNPVMKRNEDFDARIYRPLEVTVSVTLHDIRGHLLKNCNEKDPPSPIICVERFGFEMDKKHEETILQVLLSPIMLIVSDNVSRLENGDQQLKEGYLMLSGLQIRGNAMFSNEGRTLDQETLEYSWLIEILLGKLSGRLTAPHLETIVTSCETFFLLALDRENSLRSSQSFLLCYHGHNQFDCPIDNADALTRSFTDSDGVMEGFSSRIYPSVLESPEQQLIRICPTAEEIKYKMIRLSVDAVDIYLVEAATALSLWVSPIRSALCNLHGAVMKEGFTILIPNVQLRHFVMVNPSFTKRFQFSDLNKVDSSSDTMTASWTSRVETNTSVPQSPVSPSVVHSWAYLWLEAGAVALGPLCVEIAMKGSPKIFEIQNEFLIRHDRKTKRLWFLWRKEPECRNSQGDDTERKSRSVLSSKCACVGGSKFFGTNVSGTRFFWPSRKDWMDGVNVACFRVNKPGDDYGFGQSILKPSVLMFDTPPYTTQGVSLLELHAEWRDGSLTKSGKTPLTFKPSLLADLSHTSSSAPSTRSDRMSNYDSTLQSNQSRRFSHPNHSDEIDGGTHGSELRLQNDEEPKNSSKPPTTLNLGAIRNSCTESKAAVDCFHSADEITDPSSEESASKVTQRSRPAAPGATLSTTNPGDGKNYDDETIGPRKVWATNSLNSLDSLSDMSFISALSAQEECMVNLQSHLNKPITESSLLMPCYMSHLTQLKCDNWHVSAPVVASNSIGLAPFVKASDGKLVYAGSKYTPHFDPLVDGFTALAMVDSPQETGEETTGKTSSSESGVNTPSQTHFWDTPTGTGAHFPYPDQTKFDQTADEEFYRTVFNSLNAAVTSSVSTECTTVIVRTKNDINIMVSPMLLEALQKFIEALTPTLSSLHPLSVVNHLHSECISRVTNANLLKKEKSILLTRIQNSKRNTAIRTEEMSPAHSNIFEEITQRGIQGSVAIPKINITLLQASVVEEVISFSALDNIRDLMCVSMLAVAIEQTHIYFSLSEQTKKSVQVLYRPSILPKTQKKRKSKVSTSESMLAEAVFIENSERQSQLISTTINIHRMHAQLRRLKNDSSILKEAVVTAIPNQHSKVLFRFAKVPRGLRDMKESMSESSRDTLKDSSSILISSCDGVLRRPEDTLGSNQTKESTCLPSSFQQPQSGKCPDEKLGFIMCECGVEGISLKGVKNAEIPQKSEENEDTASITLCNEVSFGNFFPEKGTSVSNLNADQSQLKESEQRHSWKDESLEVNDPLDLDQADGIGSVESTLKNDSYFIEKVEEPSKGPMVKKSCPPSVSGVIQLTTMWYNFAAPPQTPITRKIDYTRVDWNLVSTASTAINAWLNPIDHLTLKIVSMFKGHAKRTSGLLASLMAEALEIQAIHQPPKSKYSRLLLTPLAKTLQDDPSCQLCIVLRRYINRTSRSSIEANVTEPGLPQLSTLRQGVIVLSRQWKNVLYTPLLLEHNLKSKKSKNFTVTFTLPQSEDESPGSDGEISAEETTDERATLLDMEGGTVSLQSVRFNKRSRGSNGSSLSEISAPNHANKALPSQPVLSSTRASDCYPMSSKTANALPIFNFGSGKLKKSRFGSAGSIVTGNWSASSNEDAHAESGRSTPGTRRNQNSTIIRQVDEWNKTNETQDLNVPRTSTLMSEQSHEESLLLGVHSKFPQHPSLLLLDAHVIFQPLLTSLGLMPEQIIGYNFDHLGSHMSVRASIELLRIDIVESESKGIGRGSLKSKPPGGFGLSILPETPAFLCEKIGLEGDFQKSTDISRDNLKSKRLFFVSRNYWKKQAKRTLIFSLSIDYISQQVNMPLLRLLHQITTMIQNVRETQLELREQRPIEKVKVNLHQKNSSSSGSDFHLDHGAGAEKSKPPKVDPSSLPQMSSSTPATNAVTSTTPSITKTSRTQSFAQRFKSVRGGPRIVVDGVVRTSSASQTPTSVRGAEFADTGIKNQQDVSSGPALKQPTTSPNCWKTIYYLLDLYGTRPETKTVINSRSVMIVEHEQAAHPEQPRILRLNSNKMSDGKDHFDEMEKGLLFTEPNNAYVSSSLEKQKESETPRLSIFGVARIQRTRLLASLSGLRLEAEILNLQATSSYKKKVRPVSIDMSLTGHCGKSMIVLLEGVAPTQQTVVKISVSQSGVVYSSVSKRLKDRNSGLLTIGPVKIDIPQHPVVLHGMMTRSSKQLSNTLQEFRVNRTSSRISRGTTFDEADFAAHLPLHVPQIVTEKQKKIPETPLFQPLVMQFVILVESLSITAALLPSLQAQYKMEDVKSSGMTGSKAKFKIHLPKHTLSFTTKFAISEANLPSAASISLPKVDVSAEYIQESKGIADSQIMDGVVIRRGSFLETAAEIGSFEHCLTTDLLNHLVFVQKVFMREVNEVVLKMSGGDKPVPFWEEEGSSSIRSLLFTLNVNLQGIQITATTPTNTAVRLETGTLEFYMSNRVRRMCDTTKSGVGPHSTLSSSGSHPHSTRQPTFNRVFVKAKVDVNLSLGQLIRNMVFEEAESEYQQYAFFKTRFGLKNDMSDETSGDAEKEVVLITLTRPLIYIQPIAVDKAILVWLNYKNAYEYWNEQRSSLNTEVLAAMPFAQVPDRIQASSSLTEQSSILFVQLTVDDMGISIPLNPAPHSWGGRVESENRGAVVITLESSSISACSYGSLVSKGKFNNLCFRFSDDMVSMDDWKPNLADPNVLNYCSVSEGTYEVCSRTNSLHQHTENAKWFLNVQWSMEGVDMHIDVNVGKQLSALGHTLTTLAAFEEEDDDVADRQSVFTSADLPDSCAIGVSNRSVSQESVILRRQKSQPADNIGGLAIEAGLGPRAKRNLLEKEMQERVSLIGELKKIGASELQIEDERRKLQELENVAYKDFRRDWIKRLRRQSTKAVGIKDKLGLGTSAKAPHIKSHSFVVNSPTTDNQNYIFGPVETVPVPSNESSPTWPSRSSSLRYRSKQRVTFGETHRQYSVDSTTPDDEDELFDAWLQVDGTDSSTQQRTDGKDGVGQITPGSSISHKALEPNIDLELDVKVFINSGKCVLHTKPKEDETESKSSRKKSERSLSGYESAGLLNVSLSPLSSRKIRTNVGTARLKSPFGNTNGTDVTIFHIPGLDVKIHYDSHILYDDKESAPAKFTYEKSEIGMSSTSLIPNQSLLNRRGGTKKASLFAWMTLHSVPEETIISPHILDFLEQTLEPIPLPAHEKSFDGTSIGTDAASGVASTYYASFPVDVIVYFHMQPSTFRFSCQPVSRVECMLRLPSLDIVFSSKRAEEKNVELSSMNIPSGKSRPRSHVESSAKEKDSQSQQLASGGLSVTGCLSDFSLYIFHPYGAAKKTAATEWSPLSDNERKDSVSMNVEFVKVNLSRSRKIYTHNTSGSDGKSSTEQQQASIRFSTIVDIGSASFKYDMRRLTEILAFPKAWYRSSIVRRLFLGDLSTASGFGDESCTGDGEISGRNSPAVVHHHLPPERRNSGPPAVFTSGLRDKLRLNFEGEKEVKRRGSKLDFFSTPKTPSKSRGEENGFPGVSKWETLVLFTVNFTKLNVQMNMGNVMGNVSWLIRDAKSDGKLSIGSTGHKNLYIGIGVGSSYIDAKGGIVAGTFELMSLSTFVTAKEDQGIEPHHTVGFKVMVLELRLDFMGTSVLMGRGSHLEVTLKDEWQVRDRSPAGPRRPESDVAMATYRPAMIFIHGDMKWDQLQLLISKSTTVDLLKMHCKLDEFFSQQFKSSKWVFSTLQVPETSPTPTVVKLSSKRLPEYQGGQWEDVRHHRHWQRVLEKVSSLSISSLFNPLPATGTVLGGTMNLHGINISLACFHGVNFKAKSWALFSLKEPFISFQTEAQETHSAHSDNGMGEVHVVQNLNVALGQNQQAMTITSSPHESMAVICRITRNVIFSPQFRTLQEWFHYAFAPSDIDDVRRFPSLERERLERERADTNSTERSIERRTPARLHDPNHNREVIFALPTMELFFKTEHLQGTETPDSAGAGRPFVECSFITEFGDHIFVTVDAEAFFFLHDLILSYIREKERLVSAQLAAGRSQSPNIPAGETSRLVEGFETITPNTSADTNTDSYLSTSTSSPVPMGGEESTLQRDWRDYHCKTWQLEPTVRLLSWAGKSIEPYGVDYILHKLGFSHARTTIPKWMQRGFMDPLDKILSVLVFRMVDLAKRENQTDDIKPNP